ncbi:unnamed protein product [Prorocentrum cordatum]|uniref:EF-hand domain-containing protein n=1 Tax=Prorocentrum cordatum TaxID=2364126 RepID=A0ABN9RUN2_9DINO|nr:unnamed protein product [Polarella glacialis]
MLGAAAPGQPPAPKGCPPARLTAAVPVEELRRLLRGDVEAVVRAELRAALGGSASGAWRARAASDEPRAGLQLRWKGATESDGGPDDAWASSEPQQPLMGSQGRRDMALSLPGTASPGVSGGSPQSVPPSTTPKSWMGLWHSSDQYDTLLQEDAPETFENMASEMMPGMGSPLTRVVRCLDALWSLREEPRTGWCAEVVQSNGFQAFFACVIATNAMVMVGNVNHDVQCFSAGNDKQNQWSALFDMCFLVLYCTELSFKLAVHRLYYFWNEDTAWNWLDFLLVMQSLIDFIMLGGGGGGGNTWMRTVRLFRIAKVLRILRVIRFFTQLHLIMSAIIGGMMSMLWSMVVFVLIFLMFSLYVVSAVATYLENDGDLRATASKELIENFGSVQICMLTLFSTISGGNDWMEYYDTLVPTGMPSSIFVLFVAFSQIALLNVVTGLFVESAIKLSEPDVHQKAEEQFQQDKEYARELKKLFEKADKDGSKRLSRDEFRAILDNGKLGHLFRFLGIDPAWSRRHLPLLFDSMVEQQQMDSQDWDTREVDPHTFVEKCMALRGAARSTEVWEIHDMLSRIQHTQEAIGPWSLHDPKLQAGDRRSS